MLGQVQVCILAAHQLNKYRDIRLILSCFVEASAALLGQAQVCILVAHQQGPCVHFSRKIYLRLIALLRILSCFLEASAALLGQVQVCILVWRNSTDLSSQKICTIVQQSCRALNLYIVLDKQIYRDICLIALLRLLFGSQCRTS